MTGNTKLEVQGREAAHSRENRRLRRGGQVPGVLYGGGDEPVSFVVNDRTLRHALAAGLTADLVGMTAAIVIGRLVFG